MRIAAIVLSAAFLAQALTWAADQSAAFDEPPSIVAGVRYRQGDLRWNREHPPLVKWLAALSVERREPPLPPPVGDVDQLQWSYGAQWLHGARQSAQSLLFSARISSVVLGMALIPLLAWTWLMLGDGIAALAAALLALTTPLWLAYSTLVNNDAAPALLLIASSACAWRVLRGSSRSRWAWSALLAVVLALALSAKHTAIGFPALILVAAALDAYALGVLRRVAAPVLLGCAGGQLGALLFAWGWPPHPELYLEGLRKVGFNHAVHYSYYAFGHTFTGRNYAYFAAALWVKTPWPVWILAVIAALGPVLDRSRAEQDCDDEQRRSRWRPIALWTLPPLGYLLGVSLFAPPIGVRYALPALPYVLLAAGAGAAWLLRSLRLRWLLLPLLLVQWIGHDQALRQGPLSWFNGFPCRSGQLDPCLDDSNVDWGQALPQLREYRDRYAPGAPVRVLYFGSSPVEAYVPNARAAAPAEVFRPEPQLYAISLHLRPRIPRSSWVHTLAPVAVVGGSYAVYDLRLPPSQVR